MWPGQTQGVFLVLLTLSLAFAGCTTKSDTIVDGDDRDPLPLPPIELPVFQFANCTSVVMPFWTPRAQLAAVLPPAFKPTSDLGGQGGLNVIVQDCYETLDNRTLHGPSRTFWTVAFVQTVNESWGERGFTNYYVLDYVTTSKGLVSNLSQIGIDIQEASIELERTEAPLGSELWAWTIQADGWTAGIHHRLRSEHRQPDSVDLMLWFGAGPYHRIRASMNGTVDTLLNEGDLTWDGESRFREALPTPVAPWRGTSHVNVSWLLEVDERVFKE